MTAPQHQSYSRHVAAAKRIYDGVYIQGERIFPGYPVGGELSPFGWLQSGYRCIVSLAGAWAAISIAALTLGIPTTLRNAAASRLFFCANR